MKKLLILLSILFLFSSCDKKQQDLVVENRKPISLNEIIADKSLPTLFHANEDEFVKYFEKIGRPDLLYTSNNKNNENAVFFTNETLAHLFYKKYVNRIEIRNFQKSYPSLSLVEAIGIAETLLPSTIPPLEKEFSKYPYSKLSFSKTKEFIYFYPKDVSYNPVNEIICYSQYESDIKEPNLPDGEEGYLPYYANISVHLIPNSISEITISKLSDKIPMHRESYLLKNSIVNENDALSSILEEGISSKVFKTFNENK